MQLTVNYPFSDFERASMIFREYFKYRVLCFEKLARKPLRQEPSVCSCIVYCQCPLHQSIAVLFVKCEHKGQYGKYVLPGGKRDLAGYEGRVKHMKYNESCWYAMKGEFAEEVSEDITNYCPYPCPYTNIYVYRSDTVSYCVRLYYFETDCSKLPSKHYGRFRLHETIERKWIPLEEIVYQFKEYYNIDKKQMTLSPQMFVTFRQFANILANYLRLSHVQTTEQRVRTFKIIKLLEMLYKHPSGIQCPQQISIVNEEPLSQFAIYQ